MRVVSFCHSLISDWNNGSAHFLRGVVWELLSRGHQVEVFEPRDGWSMRNLLADAGEEAIARFEEAYPSLRSRRYEPGLLDLDEALDGADLVLVHDWNDHDLVARIGEKRRGRGFRLLFHDTHHRAATGDAPMTDFDLRDYDGVLAFGAVLRDRYLCSGRARDAWTWHEAADTRVFRPLGASTTGSGTKEADLVWSGSWGDETRAAELHEFLLDPVKELGLTANVYGARYPEQAQAELAEAGISYGGWLANFEAPQVFSRHRVTVHLPRRSCARTLPGVPTIRTFEALACGIPLISSPWEDTESLFTPGVDFLVARNGAEMKKHLRELLSDPELARALAEHGRETVLARHTCAHRVDELLEIYSELIESESAAAAV